LVILLQRVPDWVLAEHWTAIARLAVTPGLADNFWEFPSVTLTGGSQTLHGVYPAAIASERLMAIELLLR